MSWSANLGQPLSRYDIKEAIDACEVSPAEPGLSEGPAKQLAAARCAAKELVDTVGDGAKSVWIVLEGHSGGEGDDRVAVSIKEASGE